jgi:hypothetical protein
MKAAARRHGFIAKVSSIHEQDYSEQISILAPLRSRAVSSTPFDVGYYSSRRCERGAETRWLQDRLGFVLRADMSEFSTDEG